MFTIEDAIVLAVDLHDGQKDKIGLPYIFHPLRVMIAVQGHARSIHHAMAAVLHDTMEDSGVTENNLRARGVPDKVVDAVKLLTHVQNQPYKAYIEGIIESANPIALLVKYEDARDNYNRLNMIQDKDLKNRLFDKYDWTIRKLRNYVG